MKDLRVIISGSGTFHDKEMLETVCDNLMNPYRKERNIILLVTESQVGNITKEYAEKKGYDYEVFKADWGRFPERAGYIRNEDLARNADAGIIFWDGESILTKHLLELIHEYNLMVTLIRFIS